MLPFCIQSQNIQIQINKINTDHIEGVTTKYGKQNVKLEETRRENMEVYSSRTEKCI